jgi:hypothetical protein
MVQNKLKVTKHSIKSFPKKEIGYWLNPSQPTQLAKTFPSIAFKLKI